MKQTVYLIRHKASGQFMPQLEKNRGYSHWNPATEHKMVAKSLGVPRLFTSAARAGRAIVQWNCNPNGLNKFRNYPDEGEFLGIEPDNRQKSDLEVVPADLIAHSDLYPY